MAVKLCKYECGAELKWDTNRNAFVEKDGELHSRERCAYLKSKVPKPQPAPQTQPQQQSVQQQQPSSSNYEVVEQLKAIRKLLEQALIIMDQTRQHTEIVAQAESKRSSFEKASVIIKTDPSAELSEEFPGEEEEAVV